MKKYIVRNPNNTDQVLLDQITGKINWGPIPSDNIERDVVMFDTPAEARYFMDHFWEGYYYKLDYLNFHAECGQFHPEPDNQCPYNNQ